MGTFCQSEESIAVGVVFDELFHQEDDALCGVYYVEVGRNRRHPDESSTCNQFQDRDFAVVVGVENFELGQNTVVSAG